VGVGKTGRARLAGALAVLALSGVGFGCGDSDNDPRPGPTERQRAERMVLDSVGERARIVTCNVRSGTAHRWDCLAERASGKRQSCSVDPTTPHTFVICGPGAGRKP
jgi:hypothetical protein